MILTLDLNKQQAGVLNTMMETALKSLVLQEALLRDDLEKSGEETEAQAINAYLMETVIPQRALAAEILFSVNKAEGSRIITAVS